jgi:multiple sugar transport system substrate-binding protein
VAEFTRGHPSVVIKPIPLALAAFTDQSISRCAAANPPAILKFWSGSFQKLAAAGWLEPLNERLKGTDIRQNWVPAIMG